MTVHGAKGLEAEIVFLVDTGSAPAHAGHDPELVALADDPDDASGAPLAYVVPGIPRPTPVKAAIEGLRDKAREEYRRLLYVALTRARDRLIVCGTLKARPPAEPLWQHLVRQALAPTARGVTVTLGEDVFESLEWRRDWGAEAAPAREATPPAERRPAPLPPFLACALPASGRPRPRQPRRLPVASSFTACCRRCPSIRRKAAPRSPPPIWTRSRPTGRRTSGHASRPTSRR